MVSLLTKNSRYCGTKQHYLTYISIISRGVSSLFIPSLLHTLNSILLVYSSHIQCLKKPWHVRISTTSRLRSIKILSIP